MTPETCIREREFWLDAIMTTAANREVSLRDDDDESREHRNIVARGAGSIGWVQGWMPHEIWEYLRAWGFRDEDRVKEELLAGWLAAKGQVTNG